MKYKKSSLTLLISLPLMLSGCNPKNLPLIGKLLGKEDIKEATLNVWGLWESEQTMQPIFQKYTAEHPNIKITYEDRSIMPLVDYKERVFTRAFEGKQPDIVMTHISWIKSLVGRGAAWEAPSGLFESGYLDGNFFPVVKDAGTLEKNLYTLPSSYDGLVLIYNKRHFESADIAKPPADWEEFRRDSVALTVREDMGKGVFKLIRAGSAMGLADNIDHFSDVLGLMWVQAGVEIPKELDTEQAEDALTFYTNFSKEDGVWDSSLPESIQAFASEKVSMVIAPTWRLYEILSAISDPTVVGVAAVPQAVTKAPISWATYWTWVVSKSSPNSDESWKLVKFLTDSEQQLALFSEVSKIRPFGSIYSNKALSQNLLTNGYLKPAIESAPYAKTAEIAGRSGNRRQCDALKKAVNEVISGKTSKEALITAKADIIK